MLGVNIKEQEQKSKSQRKLQYCAERLNIFLYFPFTIFFSTRNFDLFLLSFVTHVSFRLTIAALSFKPMKLSFITYSALSEPTSETETETEQNFLTDPILSQPTTSSAPSACNQEPTEL